MKVWSAFVFEAQQSEQEGTYGNGQTIKYRPDRRVARGILQIIRKSKIPLLPRLVAGKVPSITTLYRLRLPAVSLFETVCRDETRRCRILAVCVLFS